MREVCALSFKEKKREKNVGCGGLVCDNFGILRKKEHEHFLTAITPVIKK